MRYIPSSSHIAQRRPAILRSIPSRHRPLGIQVAEVPTVVVTPQLCLLPHTHELTTRQNSNQGSVIITPSKTFNIWNIKAS